jgi:hypothetical protein
VYGFLRFSVAFSARRYVTPLGFVFITFSSIGLHPMLSNADLLVFSQEKPKNVVLTPWKYQFDQSSHFHDVLIL